MFEQGSLFWIVMPIVLVVVLSTVAARAVQYFTRRKLEEIRKREQEGSKGQ